MQLPAPVCALDVNFREVVHRSMLSGARHKLDEQGAVPKLMRSGETRTRAFDYQEPPPIAGAYERGLLQRSLLEEFDVQQFARFLARLIGRWATFSSGWVSEQRKNPLDPKESSLRIVSIK
jgi:hypothetical protein